MDCVGGALGALQRCDTNLLRRRRIKDLSEYKHEFANKGHKVGYMTLTLKCLGVNL